MWRPWVPMHDGIDIDLRGRPGLLSEQRRPAGGRGDMYGTRRMFRRLLQRRRRRLPGNVPIWHELPRMLLRLLQLRRNVRAWPLPERRL